MATPTVQYTSTKASYAQLAPNEKASFLIESALNLLGIQGDDRATVEAAIPTATQAVALLSADQAVFAQLAVYWTAIAPAAAIVAAALKKQQGG